MNIAEFGNTHERYAFTGCRGRHPLHMVYSKDEYRRICKYTWTLCVHGMSGTPSPTCVLFLWMNIDEFGNIFERYAFTGCRGCHPLHAVYSYEWISLNLAIYMNAVRSRDVEDAIPYIWFIRRMNTDKYRNIFERCAFTGRRGRHPLHCFIWMSIGKYGIYMNAVRSRDVEDAIPYIVIFIVRTPSPTCGLFEGWIPINMEIFLNTSRSRDVCTSKSRCASQGRHPTT